VKATKKKLFDQKTEEASAKVQFATNAQDAKNVLQELVNNAEEPALAEEVNLSQQAISIASTEEVMPLKMELGELYNTVHNRALPEGGKEAQNALETVERYKSSPIFSELVSNKLSEISKTSSKYINTPYSYF